MQLGRQGAVSSKRGRLCIRALSCCCCRGGLLLLLLLLLLMVMLIMAHSCLAWPRWLQG